MYTLLHKNIYMNMCTHTHIYKNSPAHIYAQTYIYKHTNIYVHTQTRTAYIQNMHTCRYRKTCPQTNITVKYPSMS